MSAAGAPAGSGPLVLRHDRDLSLADIVSVAGGRIVALDPDTRAMLDARRREVVAHVRAHGAPAYGFNRGFGSNVKDAVPADRLEELQVNLIRSHACGFGEPAPEPVVRATMLLRARSLARGHSGVRAAVVEAVIAALNAGVVPLVPRYGSVSASGDLAPLSHVALALIGEGEAFLAGQRLPAAAALARAGLVPLRLEMKEGLALNNGCQFSNAVAALATDAAQTLMDTALVASSVSVQVLLGADTPFRTDLHALRRHPGSRRAAASLWRLMEGSPLRAAHRPYDVDGEVQDPYSLRCTAQILGPCLDLVTRARETVEIEANSVTDNPVILDAPDGKRTDIVSGGHFHGMPLAVDTFGLLQAFGIAARLSNLRCVKFVDADKNRGLGPQLKWPGPMPDPAAAGDRAVSSGMLMPEYASAGLVNALWGAAMPSHLFSLPTDSGWEDHVSMAINLAWRAYDALPRVADQLAIELAYGAQGAAIRKSMCRIPSRPAPGGWSETFPADSMRLSAPAEAALAAVARHFPTVTRDRYLAGDLASLAAAVLSGDVRDAAAAALGRPVA